MDDFEKRYAGRVGRTAYIHYKGGAVGDDSLIDDRSTGEPLAVHLGSSALPPGIERVLYLMEVGEEREIVLESEEAYGYYDPKGVQWYTRVMIPNGENLHTGDVLVYTRKSDGQQLPARIIEETEDGLKIDLNHPFAGKQLKYWIRLEELR